MGTDDIGRSWPELTTEEAALVDEVSSERLMEDTRRIAEWIRLSGSQDEGQAVEYVRRQLEDSGMPATVVWHQALISLPGPARLVCVPGSDGAAGTREIGCITHSFGVSTPVEGIEGQLVYVGRGAAADYAGLDAGGKIALIDGLASPESTKVAEAHGVIGHIHVNDEYLHEMTISPVWGSPAAGQTELLPRTPAFSIRETDGQWLRSQLGGPVAVRMYAEVDTGWRQIPLVLGSLPGTDEPDRYVLFSGHLDSWHYGAMDNGSANATMLEVVRVLARNPGALRRGLKVAFWSGHSHGRYAGSAWYADQHWLDIERNCVAHVNVDSTGGIGACVLGESNVMAEVRDFAASCVAPLADGEQFVGTRFSRAGDQSFWGHGVPALFMSMSQQPASSGRTAESFAAIIGPGRGRAGGLGWWWHTEHDTVDKIDPDNLLRDTRIYALAVYRLCSAPVLPIDYRPVCDEMRDALRGITRRHPVARQHVGELHSQLDELQVLLERVALVLARLAWTRDNRRSGRRPAAAGEAALSCANTLLMRLGRALIPAGYVAGSNYDQDPALPAQPLPGLAAAALRLSELDDGSDQYQPAVISLIRERNRVAHAASAAMVLAAEWLAITESGR